MSPVKYIAQIENMCFMYRNAPSNRRAKVTFETLQTTLNNVKHEGTATNYSEFFLGRMNVG